MKKLFLFLVMLMAGLTASAYEYPYLTFQRTDGSEQSVAVESLTLTMADGKLIAVNGNGTQTFTLSELGKMFFSETETGIETIELDNSDASDKIVFDLQGRLVSVPSVSPNHMVLSKGIYVVKQNGVTRKIAVK